MLTDGVTYKNSFKMDLFLIFFVCIWVCGTSGTNYNEYLIKSFYKTENEDRGIRETDGEVVYKECNEDKLMLHLATLEIISPDRIITLTTYENIHEFCA